MDVTEIFAIWLASLRPGAVPDVRDVRPCRCKSCGVPAIQDGRVILQGHGVRERTVVVFPAVSDLLVRIGTGVQVGSCLQIGTSDQRGGCVQECWERRYRCTACRSVEVVLPEGVMPRFLYSAAAIVMAFFFVGEQPVGDGMTDAEAYDRQGMLADVLPKVELDPCYRWRSLERWARLAQQWWSSWTGSLRSLLAGFVERSGGQGRIGVLRVAVGSHVRWGHAR